MRAYVENLLLSASLRNTARDDVRYYVPRLDPREKQLTDLAQTADRIQISLTESTHAVRNVVNVPVRGAQGHQRLRTQERSVVHP